MAFGANLFLAKIINGPPSGKEGGVLLARVTASFLGEGTQCMEFAPWCGAICILDDVA